MYIKWEIEFDETGQKYHRIPMIEAMIEAMMMNPILHHLKFFEYQMREGSNIQDDDEYEEIIILEISEEFGSFKIE